MTEGPYTLDLNRYRTELAKLEWIKDRRRELDEQEHEARSNIEELLPPIKSDQENIKVVGTLDGKPFLEFRPTKTKRLNQQTLRQNFPNATELCTEVVYGRAMHLLEPKE